MKWRKKWRRSGKGRKAIINEKLVKLQVHGVVYGVVRFGVGPGPTTTVMPLSKSPKENENR